MAWNAIFLRQLDITDKDDDAWKNIFNLQKQFSEKNKELLDFQARKRQKKEEEILNGTMFDKLVQSVNKNYNMPALTLSVPSTSTPLSSVSTNSSMGMTSNNTLVEPAVNGLLDLASSTGGPNQDE